MSLQKRLAYLLFLFMSLALLAVGCQAEEPASDAAEATVVVEETATSTELSTSVSPTPEPTPIPPTATPEPQPVNWWNDAVFYEVFVRSFYDSDGDGIGDISGLIEKLDYLNDGDPNTTDDLGVTGIWLMPVMQSPSYHGYDIVDYYQIDDEYGTNEDFLRLMDEAHARGIRVIVDLVLNHTSSQHPWFIEARNPDSDQRDWYIWADESANGWHQSGDAYYYGWFWSEMPDLNFENPDVTVAMQDMMRFWLEDMGADGFRLDAIKHLIEDGRILENTPATHDWLAENFYPFYKRINPEAIAVGEIWSTTDDIAPYVGDEMDLAFEFALAEAILQSAQTGQKVHIERAMPMIEEAYPPGQYATFLANHDQTRTRSRLLNDEQAKVAASLQLMSPGVPFIYYGEEIGMQGDKPDENIRRPMQWDETGGYSTGEAWHPYFDDFQERHVAGQNGDPNSLINHYRELIALRNEHNALRNGDWLMVETDQKSIYAFLRYDNESAILVLVNLRNKPAEEYSLMLGEGPLTAVSNSTIIMGEGDIQAPTLNTAGGFENYQPLPSLPETGTVIIQFELGE